VAVLDFVIAGALLLSIALGAWRGLVYEVLSMLNWLLAFVLAQWLGHDVGVRLPLGEGSETLRLVMGYVLVFLVSVFAGAFVIWLASKLVEQVGLRPVDRVLGGVFGLLRGLVVLLACTVLVLMTSMKSQPWWRDSVLAQTSVAALKTIKPVLPQGVKKYLPSGV
jgi:membrane protein required for colicin V production